jgi:hypothetical protein
MSEANPFATRFTRPGAVEFLFPEGDSAAAVVARLAESQWQGQIVGPHGSGKSTLVASLIPAIEAAGRKIERFTIQGGQRGLPAELSDAAWDDKTLVVLDGFEQLGWLARRKLRGLVSKHRAGLLVTAHQDVGLPTVFQTQPSEKLAHALVAKLVPAGDTSITPADDSRA